MLIEPSTATAVAGTSVNLKVSTVTTGGRTGLTTLSTGPLPAGVTGTFAPPNLGPNAYGLLTLTTSGSTPAVLRQPWGQAFITCFFLFVSLVKSQLLN